MPANLTHNESHISEEHARSEELANVITHALGILISFAGLIVMLIVSQGDTLRVISSAVFGGALLFVYTSSTLYHAESEPQKKTIFRALDHSAIYLLIAGSYTPLSLINAHNTTGWIMLALLWTFALAGVSHKLLQRSFHNRILSTSLYLLMGWLAAWAFGPIIRALSPEALTLLIAGGVSYTFGVVFYLWDKLLYNHAIWHIFVLIGSVLHILAATLHILA